MTAVPTTPAARARTPAFRPARRTTAAAVLAAAEPFGVAVECDELVYAPDLLPDLAAAVGVLHTGLRALLTGRRWFGCGSAARTASPVALNPSAPIPGWVALLAVEGDNRWDRIGPTARLDFPELFDR